MTPLTAALVAVAQRAAAGLDQMETTGRGVGRRRG